MDKRKLCVTLLGPYNNFLSFCFKCIESHIFLIWTHTLFRHLLQIK